MMTIDSFAFIERIAAQQSTIDIDELAAFLFYIPKNYEQLVFKQVSAETLELLYLSDSVNWQIRQCLADEVAMTEELGEAIQKYLDYSQEDARQFITNFIRSIGNEIIEHEWYELYPFYQALCQRIEKDFTSLTHR